MRRVIVAVLWLTTSSWASAQVPESINYQGRLLNGTNLVSGSVELVFSLWDQLNAGTQVYIETQQVTVVDGFYAAAIGASNPEAGSLSDVFADYPALWLQVSVDSVPLLPRERMLAVPYAFVAGGVTNGAIQSAMLADGSVTAPKLAPGVVGPAALAKPYQAGSVPVTVCTADATPPPVTVAFSPPFTNTPILTMTVALEPAMPSDDSAAGWALLPAGKSVSNFSARLVLDPTQRSTQQVLEAVDSIGDFSMAMAYDGAAIAYCATAALYYAASRNQFATGSWEKVGVCYPANTPSLAMLSNRNPAVSYNDMNVGGLFYAAAGNRAGTGAWAIASIDTNGGGQVQTLAVIGGFPAVAYNGGASNDLRYARAMDPMGTGTWSIVTVDSAGDVGAYAALAEVQGLPGIAYADSSTKRLKYARGQTTLGGAWDIAVVASNEPYQVSLAVINGRPCLAFSDSDSGLIYYARADDAAGTGTWKSVTIAGGYFARLMRVRTVPAIAYRDPGVKYAWASDDAGTGTWNQVTVGADTGVGYHVALLPVENLPCIAWDVFSIHMDDDLLFTRFACFTGMVDWIAVQR